MPHMALFADVRVHEFDPSWYTSVRCAILTCPLLFFTVEQGVLTCARLRFLASAEAVRSARAGGGLKRLSRWRRRKLLDQEDVGPFFAPAGRAIVTRAPVFLSLLGGVAFTL